MRIWQLLAIVAVVPAALSGQQKPCTEIAAQFTAPVAVKLGPPVAILNQWSATVELPGKDQKVSVTVSLLENFGDDLHTRVQSGNNGIVEYISSHDEYVDNKGHFREEPKRVWAPVANYPKFTHIYFNGINDNSFQRNALPLDNSLKDLVTSLHYKVSWTGPVERPAIDLKAQETTEPWTEYRAAEHYLLLNIPSEGIPLNDVLHVEVFSPDGLPLTCFTAHL